MFDVDDWQKVLFTGFDYGRKVLQLFPPVGVRAVKVVAAHFQTDTLGFAEVAGIGVVDQRGALSGFQIGVGNLSVARHGVPIDFPLIVRHVYAFLAHMGITAGNAGMRLDHCRHHMALGLLSQPVGLTLCEFNHIVSFAGLVSAPGLG